MFLHLYPWTTVCVCIMHTANKMRLLKKENAWSLGRKNLFLWCFRVYSTCLHYLTQNLTTLDSPLLSMMSVSGPPFPVPWGVNLQRTLNSCHGDLMWKIGTAIPSSFVGPTFDPIFTRVSHMWSEMLWSGAASLAQLLCIFCWVGEFWQHLLDWKSRGEIRGHMINQ